MERKQGNPNGLFLLGGKCQRDCQQPVLNAWLYYLQTGVLPDQAVILYATRRYDPLELRATGVQRAVVGVLDFKRAAREPWCRRVISEFAWGPYGQGSIGRYMDDIVMVPDLFALSLAVFGDAAKSVEDDGFLTIFTKVLAGSRFHRRLVAVRDLAVGSWAPKVPKPPFKFILPAGCLVSGATTPQVLWSRTLAVLKKNWHKCNTRRNRSRPFKATALQFGLGEVEWMPIVFSTTGVPLMLCNAQYHKEISFSMAGHVDHAVVAHQMLVPWGGLGVFRRPDLVTVDRRVVAPSYLKNHPTTHLRLQLFDAVDAASDIICNSLDTSGVDNSAFWEMTVDKVYRINLASGGPIVREFALHSVDPQLGGHAPPACDTRQS